MTPSQKQIALVRNLLALTRSPFPAEADEAKKKAIALSAKWGVTEAHLAPPVPPGCPGCPACRPMRGRVVVVQYAGSSTTSGGSISWNIYA